MKHPVSSVATMDGYSLKSDNKLPLFGLIVGNIVIFYGVIQSDRIIVGDWVLLGQQMVEALPAGLALALVGIINTQLSPEAKARIVFMRWTNALPGCEAFSRYAGTDPRIDIESLRKKYVPLPVAPQKQNALWYKLYKSVEAEPAVLQVHREFLFSRDYTCLALMMLIVLGTAGLLQTPSLTTGTLYIALLFAQFILAMCAARNHGRRFVTTVLAIKAAE